MIKDNKNQKIETFDALLGIVKALDKRFPEGNSIFQRVSRLTEECGEVASAINHKENMGIKNIKHGKADDDHLVKELQDTLRAILGIAQHYKLEGELEKSIENFYKQYQKEGLIN